jgi:hypothetical protein
MLRKKTVLSCHTLVQNGHFFQTIHWARKAMPHRVQAWLVFIFRLFGRHQARPKRLAATAVQCDCVKTISIFGHYRRPAQQ